MKRIVFGDGCYVHAQGCLLQHLAAHFWYRFSLAETQI